MFAFLKITQLNFNSLSKLTCISKTLNASLDIGEKTGKPGNIKGSCWRYHCKEFQLLIVMKITIKHCNNALTSSMLPRAEQVLLKHDCLQGPAEPSATVNNLTQSARQIFNQCHGDISVASSQFDLMLMHRGRQLCELYRYGNCQRARVALRFWR